MYVQSSSFIILTQSHNIVLVTLYFRVDTKVICLPTFSIFSCKTCYMLYKMWGMAQCHAKTKRIILGIQCAIRPLRWRHNDHSGVSNHQPHGCLLNRLFRCKSKKHQSSASLAFVREIHRGPVNFPHKWPVTRKMFPFDNVIMQDGECCARNRHQGKGQAIKCHRYCGMWLLWRAKR